MGTMASQITSLTIVYSTVIQAQIKENIKAPRHWPLCGEFTGTGEFPAQRSSNAENVSIWWRHHESGTVLMLRNCYLLDILAAISHNRIRMMVDTWWRHQMETFSALLDLCAGNSPVTGEFPPQRPVMRSFDVFFDLRLNKRLSKQSWDWWFETPSRSL